MDIELTLKNYLTEDKKLKAMPTKNKLKGLAYYYLATKFEKEKQYTEKEVNAVINNACAFTDPATLRRDLIELKYLKRTSDCKTYWLGELPDPSIFEEVKPANNSKPINNNTKSVENQKPQQ
jgi:hypothetical protein